jgi:sugar O-acyltransferase (sialic acid O-acetyltransferase NeuD family)
MTAILGAGPHGREVAEVARALGHDLLFYDDDLDVPSLGPIALAVGRRWVAGAAWPAVRRKIIGQMGDGGAAILVHPQATVADGCDLAPGVVVAAGVHLSIDVTVGPHVHVGIGAVVSRDVHLGGCVTVCPNAAVAGGVLVEEDVFIGVGAVIAHELVIGAGALIGAGAVVVEDVPPGAVVVGNPARPLR